MNSEYIDWAFSEMDCHTVSSSDGFTVYNKLYNITPQLHLTVFCLTEVAYATSAAIHLSCHPVY